MSLEIAMRRLALQPSNACRQCRRTFASSAQQHNAGNKSATGSFAELLASSRSQESSNPSRPQSRARGPPTTPTRTATSRSATPSSASNPSNSSFDLARTTLGEIAGSNKTNKQTALLADLERTYTRQDLEKQAPRRWKVGSVYAPHDLSGVEASKWKKMNRKPALTRRTAVGGDVLDQLGLNPIAEYKNFSMMAEYVTEMGRIQHRNQTGLRPVNQRKMAKAIRRAIGLGLMPSVYRHPELIRNEQASRGMSYR